MKRFCKICGNSLKDYDIIGYDEITGSPIHDRRCSENPCHQGHDYKSIRHEMNRVLHFFSSYHYYRCSFCKQEYKTDYGSR